MFGRSIREGIEENEQGEQQRKEEMDGESRRRGNEEMKQRREAETEDERRTTVGKVKAARISSFTLLSLFSSGLQAAYIQQVEGGKRTEDTCHHSWTFAHSYSCSFS